MLVGAAACELQLEDFTSKPGEEEPDLVVVKWADTIQPEPKCVMRSTCACVSCVLFLIPTMHGIYT